MSKYTDYTIIVEGCDLTGKDTLCLKLAERYYLDFVHISSHDPNDYPFYYETMRKKNIVYSRHWVGDLRAGQAFGVWQGFGQKHPRISRGGFRKRRADKNRRQQG